MSVITKLNDGQDAYDFVGEYVERFWKRHGIYEPLVVDLSKSYDNSDWVRSIELVEKDFDRWVTVFENDWWEGEKYIILHGIASLYDLEIEGGIFND